MEPAGKSDRTWCDLKHFWGDWYCRNQMRFQNYIFSSDHKPCWQSIYWPYMTSSMTDFQILQSIQVTGKPSTTPKIKLVMWYPPLYQWVKINTDGATCESLGSTISGEI